MRNTQNKFIYALEKMSDSLKNCPTVESVDKVAPLLAEMPLAENPMDFRTALYSRQYHPRALKNRLTSGFRLQGVFLPHMSAEKQKCG